jgi:hypothetical protein
MPRAARGVPSSTKQEMFDKDVNLYGSVSKWLKTRGKVRPPTPSSNTTRSQPRPWHQPIREEAVDGYYRYAWGIGVVWGPDEHTFPAAGRSAKALR